MKANLRNLSELEESLEAPYNQGVLTYIKSQLPVFRILQSPSWDLHVMRKCQPQYWVNKLTGFASELRRPMEVCSRTKTWISNMVQSGDTPVTQCNCLIRGKNNHQSSTLKCRSLRQTHLPKNGVHSMGFHPPYQGADLRIQTVLSADRTPREHVEQEVQKRG